MWNSYCGNSRQFTQRLWRSKAPASSADEKLTCWLPLTSNAAMLVSNYGETALAKELIKKTGVNVEFVHPPQGQESEKFSIIVSSSDLPDIIEYNWLNYPGGPAQGQSRRA